MRYHVARASLTLGSLVAMATVVSAGRKWA